jgi:hypothetical protein
MAQLDGVSNSQRHNFGHDEAMVDFTAISNR